MDGVFIAAVSARHRIGCLISVKPHGRAFRRCARRAAVWCASSGDGDLPAIVGPPLRRGL